MKIWELKPLGTLWATPGLLRDCFTFLTGCKISYRPSFEQVRKTGHNWTGHAYLQFTRRCSM